MSGNNIRWGWLKFMYIYTAVGAGGYGLGMILAPNLITTIFRMPDRDPVVFGVTGSLYVTFGLLSLLALRSRSAHAAFLQIDMARRRFSSPSARGKSADVWSALCRRFRDLCHRGPDRHTLLPRVRKTARSIRKDSGLWLRGEIAICGVIGVTSSRRVAQSGNSGDRILIFETRKGQVLHCHKFSFVTRPASRRGHWRGNDRWAVREPPLQKNLCPSA